MKTIRVKCEIQKKQGIVLLEFDFDLEIKELVKVIPHSTWNPSLKAWTLPYHEEIIEKLLAHFQGKAWLDYSKFRKISSDHLLPSLPVLNGYLEGEIKKFREWMQNRRYAESTVKTYCQSLSLFFRFLENKNPEEINSEDLENFHQNYVLKRKYSVSFQSQVINAVKLYFSNRQKRSLDPIEIERPKKPRLLPHVLSKEEIEHDTSIKLVQ